MKATEITDDNYQSFIAENPMAVIDFWGPKCSNCKALAPHIERLADEYNGKCAFGKYNVDGRWDHVASSFNVKGVPSILVYKNGKLIDHVLGYDNKTIPWLNSRILKNINS